jgi:hypothetical protein
MVSRCSVAVFSKISRSSSGGRKGGESEDMEERHELHAPPLIGGIGHHFKVQVEIPRAIKALDVRTEYHWTGGWF